MEIINTKVKKWGNSLGIILPREVLNNQQIKEGLEIEVSIRPRHKTKAKDLFGILKGKLTKSTDELMKEVDEDFEKNG